MKLTVLAENLQKKLSLVNHAISSRNQLPILSFLLLETKDGKLSLHATDLEIGIETSLTASIEEEGITTVPAKLFSELINSLPAEKITITTEGESVVVETKQTKSVLQTMNKDEFPALYEEKGKEALVVKAKEFRRDLGMVAFAASLETTRPALSGILMKKESEGFIFVATDGYRLSYKIDPQQTTTSEEKPMLVPARVIREVLAFKEEEDIHVFVSSQNNQIVFSQDDTLLVGRLIEAEFPNYKKIIPTEASAKIAFDREELLKAVKTCAIFARETANIIKFSLQKDKMVVSAKTPSLGENTVEIEAQLTGEENEIAFNARYLLDVLSAIPDNNMVFEMTGPLNAGVFKLANDPNFLHLIMPIRV